MRYALEISYQGTHYHGWQMQKNTPRTIQQILNEQLSVLLQQPLTVTGAARTDAGVHAAQNFAHFDFDGSLPADFCRRLNFLLPPDISLTSAFEVASDFHARFDAISRTYRYRISYRKNAFYGAFMWHYPYRPLSLDRLNEVAHLVASHSDFAAFSKKRTQVATTRCKIFSLYWQPMPHDPHGIEMYIMADRFLRGMVRAIVAMSIRYARGKLTLADIELVLQSAQAQQTDFAAPAQGLTLLRVAYDKPMKPLH